MNFYTKIKELEETYLKINLERTMLEKKMENRQEYRREFFDTKAVEVKEEIASIEVDKVKCQARNRNLHENIQKALD
jgi:hypothetical protein